MSDILIDNRMEDCGNGRHVGWWSEDYGFGHNYLLIEIKPGTLVICACEGEHAEKRINFVTNQGKGIAIVRAMMAALGIKEDVQ